MFDLVAICFLIKLLLVFAYHSTDFEVHRNWLRITYNLPLREWYYDDVSIWTLDYPPLFAYFEYILTFPARFFDMKMLETNQEYKSENTVIYQRATVMISDLLFLYAICNFIKVSFGKNKQNYAYAVLFTFLQFGFLLVDNIHFQYNQFLQGIFILSLTKFIEGRNIFGGILFALVLCFKHIFLYSAPAIFFFLLKFYCFDNGNKLNIRNFSKLGMSVVTVFLISFLPFLSLDAIKQILSRMFPFQRGLVHAYWAPNFWALYCFADKVLSTLARKLLKIPISSKSTLTSGVVQVTQFDILPEIKPIYTIMAIIIISLPLWYKIVRNPKAQNILLYSSIQMFIFYMLGYHVHEKAILLPLGIYQLWAIGKQSRSRFVLLFSFVSGVGLLPLLPEHSETGLKIIGLFIYHLAYWAYLRRDCYREAQNLDDYKKFGMNFFAKFIIFSGTIIAIYGNVLHYILFLKSENKFEYLPLMIHSVYGGILNLYFIIEMYLELFRSQNQISIQEVKQ
ncbi:dolichyl pyrophosphate Glc1Man9GlcNAc2 alpha-1,3-glucosyltransferase-like protein, putative (macronuclear) [Tetrahymena thermophila SB210]|uniref:Alpha-1,3-glucosyltransferase n=1 Tax=Tetrahymena thermophila (strain SB210) TaxID=312017 RepID=I7LUU2_TETTS|nr:dolichyl pyrophosphate Glc1Man9GlcNAc2 alpha-1,3-glucosyltransferase-like protein, putative [Tetrahymena thermophila SB210]EAR96049.2 dolichyl pyrophosphate Glc1Man9GlcNAc2 alpha-1,3-glucosyltransferase-like protein, putative [Tetrahymena thermophila SB210]|eukprot:XP_001016294.2 dolichyl pyrophosphate Glc1Man9GlcNAc2 alpha-1,3-glucosyltransferase-like protein, putative [Tetrahymena thermophila SB210]